MGAYISIHVPRMRHDTAIPQPILDGVISIHVPRMRHDNLQAVFVSGCDDFNPRASHEARRAEKPYLIPPETFQSTCLA